MYSVQINRNIIEIGSSPAGKSLAPVTDMKQKDKFASNYLYVHAYICMLNAQFMTRQQILSRLPCQCTDTYVTERKEEMT